MFWRDLPIRVDSIRFDSITIISKAGWGGVVFILSPARPLAHSPASPFLERPR